MSDQQHRQRTTTILFWAAFCLLCAASLIPLWSVRIPPMQDIWQHLALVNVLHTYNDPGSIFPEFFMLPQTPKPNLLYYYGTHWLAFLTPTIEDANKVVLSIYVLTFPLGFLYFLRSFGKSRWLSFFSFPLIYNSMFSYGFVSFLLGMPILLVGVGAYRRFTAREGTDLDARSGVIAAVAMLLAFFTHAHIFLLLCFLCGILFLLHRDRGWGALLRLAPFAPGLVFFVPWFVVYFLEHTPSTTGMSFGSFDKFFGPTFYKPSQILGSFFFYVGDYFRGERDDALFVALILAAMTLLMLRSGPTIPPGERRKMRYYDLEILTLVLSLSALLLPQHIESQAIVSLRHVVFAVLFFFGWLGVENVPRRVAVPALVTVMGLHLAGVANLVSGFKSFEHEIGDYPALFERTDPGKRLLKITYNQESRVVNHGALWHMHFFYTILKNGVSDLQFAEYPHNPIQYRPGMVPPQTGVEFNKSPAWRYYDYVLLRKSSQPPLKTVEDRLEPIGETDDWTLYKVLDSPAARGPEVEPLAKPRRTDLDSAGTVIVPKVPKTEAGVLHATPLQRDGPRLPVGPRDLMRRRLGDGEPVRPAPGRPAGH
jgi:hypothetical protein